MNEEDFIEKPSCQILYRQSSVETRLSPIHLSDEDDTDERDNLPKVIDCALKQKANENQVSQKLDFKNVLEKKLGVKQAIAIKPVTSDTETAITEKYVGALKGITDQVSETHNARNLDFKNELDRKFRAKTAQETDIKTANKETDLKIVNTSITETAIIEKSVGLLKALSLKNKSEEDATVEEATIVNHKKEKMNTLRPKSPGPRPVPVKGEKDESIWDKLGTLGRKKRIKEVQEVQEEGKYAIDSPGCPTAPITPPEDYNLDDNEEVCVIDSKAYEDPKFLDLLTILKEWINDELASQRIIIQDLAEDLYDGQVLQKLLEKLTGDKLDAPEVTQSEEGQKHKLTVVLNHFNQVLGIQRLGHNKWNVEAIHSKNIVAITHLLVALARHFRPPVRLPEHVSVNVVVVQKVKGQLISRRVCESLTTEYEDVGMRCERDAFDTLFDHAPDKLQVVKKSLVTFVNKHLNKMHFEVTEIESQFHDGVYLIMLMGLLEGFFVPHYVFHLTPHEFDQKVHNVSFAFELMEEVGLQKPKARPEDVVNMDLKSTLRVLYNLFLKYRTVI